MTFSEPIEQILESNTVLVASMAPTDKGTPVLWLHRKAGEIGGYTVHHAYLEELILTEDGGFVEVTELAEAGSRDFGRDFLFQYSFNTDRKFNPVFLEVMYPMSVKYMVDRLAAVHAVYEESD